jgi:hypothetical protein
MNFLHKLLPFYFLLLWPVPLAQVLPRPQLIFPLKIWFFFFFFKFSAAKITLESNMSHILNPTFTKKITLNPAHQDLSNNTKGTFQFLLNFQL